MTTRVALRPAINEAVETLRTAGVHSPQADAEHLAAHVLGVQRTRLMLTPLVSPAQLAAYRELVARRAERIPLQHLIGTAVMGALDLAVGPGVFVPRPETELLYAWALAQLEALPHDHAPVVVDLCTGSGALALAVAHTRPDAEVHAVELDPAALVWARRNADDRIAAGDTPITLYADDATDPALLTDLNGRVDIVVSNPPYIPEGAPLDPEVADHDPSIALFGGPDGLAVIRGMIPNITRLLRPGGATAIEHDDTNGSGVAALLTATGAFTDVVEHPDLAGKPRFVAATHT
ncbi:peptide chain release factor N(5)-glutamine methyltransferase [Nocardia sp. CDC186]|uniref:Release factor glutamine methyltransferase n=1 Tax=Nocardia implantans TaxID=3108168 RepID=A0ABU6AVY0_9NOCA|nr:MULTISPECIES: peptide chain release factor N(5)-glutamine methyltransferase [unclassified Nocardia]MBF6193179.1 peptide chain release factor N(5)-glutamine methyltransferase [Nocardia beijingensis]MEA3527223.1 peptide chain release factor N(5)-glutamine methyltransferase [Nocardia sp. CDC192]MEB3511447.1 peptide chain release factor N(5)-glutamine methyltransferase [Nocardia sp. CDC186]